jgi:hypothetical protein
MNCIWLTNELILAHGVNLSAEDRAFYRKSLQAPKDTEEEKRNKRRASERAMSRERRRRRLADA